MKTASANMLKLLATDTRDGDPGQLPMREKLGLVARAFVELQQARHRDSRPGRVKIDAGSTDEASHRNHDPDPYTRGDGKAAGNSERRM